MTPIERVGEIGATLVGVAAHNLSIFVGQDSVVKRLGPDRAENRDVTSFLPGPIRKNSSKRSYV